jgi:glycosyltransferase involved in cell wall biosynthesis
MTVKRPRVFIADFDLVEYSGHFFNQVFGLREAAHSRGLETRIYVASKADPRVAEELDGHAILPTTRWRNVKKDVSLEDFASAHGRLNPLWNDLETAHVSELDILVITSSRPPVIFGVGQWLRARPASARPSVFFRFFGPEFFDFEAKVFSDDAWAYHFASRHLPDEAGGERTFFTLNNKKALTHLETLSLRRTFYLPVPKYYGPVAELPVSPSQPLTIYVHVNRKAGPISDRVVDLVSTLCKRHGDVKFLIRFCKYAYGRDDFHKTIDMRLVDRNVEILPAEQNHVEYLATIERSDMVLLPYNPVEYRGIVSGIFCEAAAMGKVAIVPAETWIADHITEGRATGVLFGENSVADMTEAVERAIRDRKRLQAEAYRNAPSFREENSCAKNLEGMLELAGQAHDMRLSYVPLTDATKALGSQFYFGEGWSEADEGFGTWSDGTRATINFSVKSNAKALFFSAQVLPFLTRSHPRVGVSLTANSVPVAEWSFDAARPDDREWSWRHVQIPEEITASGEIQIVLSIRSPASPEDLGLSIDSRKLGIALRKFSLKPEMHAPEADPSERPSTLDRLRGRIKRTLKQALSSPE